MGISRRFLNLIKDNSYRGTKGLVFNSAISPSRKLSTVGSGSESLPNLFVDRSFPGITSLRLVDLRGQLFNTSTRPSTFGGVLESAAVDDISSYTHAADADNLKKKLAQVAELKMDWRGQLFNRSTLPSTLGEVPESAAVDDISSYTNAADADDLKKKQAQVDELKMDWLQLPAPIFSFESTDMLCPYDVDLFPLTDRKMLINHPSAGTFFFDVDTYDAAPVPNIRHKGMPMSLFVPSEDEDADDHLAGGGSLYIMEKIPNPEVRGSMLSDQFEALEYSRSSLCQSAGSRLLPPPPFVCDPAYQYPYPRITAYAAVGSNIYISAESFGTYCLDTLSNTWDRVGQWILPFHGKVEYVPELKLWFGLSMEHGHLAAADLSDMNSEPQLVDSDNWKELELPDEWLVDGDSQLVNLGSGRFCIARFFYTLLMNGDSVDEINQILVLTGVEVTSPVHDGNRSGSCSREVKLGIRQHKSLCHMCDHTRIAAVF